MTALTVCTRFPACEGDEGGDEEKSASVGRWPVQAVRVESATNQCPVRSARNRVRLNALRSTTRTAPLRPQYQCVEHRTEHEGDRHGDHQKDREQPPEL